MQFSSTLHSFELETNYPRISAFNGETNSMELMLSSVIELEMDCYGCRDQTINDYYVSVGWGHVIIVWMSVMLG